MYHVTEEVSFPYGHRLLDHPGRCGRLHGHNARVEVVLEAEELDAAGFVADFDEVQAALRALVDERFDHRLRLQEADPVIPHLEAAGEEFVALREPPTAEVLARLVFEGLAAAGLPVVEVRLWEMPTAVASYRLSCTK